MAWKCSEERTLRKELDIGALNDIRVLAGPGELSIKGSEQQGKIALVAKLCASEKSMLAEMDVKTGIENEMAVIKADIPKKWGGNYSAAIDLSLTVPDNAKLNVKDSSGDLEIGNVAKLSLVDSAGDVVLKHIVGHVELTDSSGSVNMHKIGSAEVTDSSGGIDVRDVVNDFTIVVDSSGDIDVQGVGGDLLIKVDSSGSIDVEDIAGSFIVEKDGAGDIRYDNVGGEVNIPVRKR